MKLHIGIGIVMAIALLAVFAFSGPRSANAGGSPNIGECRALRCPGP
jgi:hypothetical protein